MARAKTDKTATGARASRRERLLDNAARQLNARGLSLTSLAELAESLGVSRAALYYYVDDLPDLVFQCYRRSCEVLARNLEEAMSAQPSPPQAIEAFIASTLDPEQPEIAMLAEVAILSPDQQAIVRGLFHSTAARLAGLIAQGSAAGDFRPLHPLVGAHTLLSVLFWVPLAKRWSEDLTEVERPQVIAEITSIMLNGLARERTAAGDFGAIDLDGLRVRARAVFDREGMAEAKREALIAAASVLFNRKGVDATSLDEIAARVGATKRTLYHHVGDKQDLVGACYRRAFRIYHYVRDRTEEHPGHRLDALTASFHALALCNLQEELCPLMPLVGFDALRPHEQSEIADYVASNSRAYLSFYAAGQKEGSLRRLDDRAVALCVPGCLAWLARAEPSIADLAPDLVAREVAAIIRLGFTALPNV